MSFIETDNIIINTDMITRVEKVSSKYDPEKAFSTRIHLCDGTVVSVGHELYDKVNEILKPTRLA